MTIVAGRRLIGKAGAATTATCKLLIVSQYSQNVTLSLDGASIPLTVMGDDAPAAVTVTEAGYYAHYTVSNLSSNKSYSYTLTQSGTPDGTLTFTGTLHTAPGENDDFAVVLYSCSGGNSAGTYPGAWATTKAYAQKNKIINPRGLDLVAVFGVDDTAYLDSMTLDDSANTGHKLFTLADSEMDTEYDACVRWMVWGGMVDAVTGTRVLDARESNRSWCNDNLNMLFMWGDHEMFDNVGYAPNGGTYALNGTSTSSWQTTTLFAKRETAYNIFCKSINGDAFSTEARAGSGFSLDIGCLHYMALDRNYADSLNKEGNGAFVFTQDQIDGFTSALSASDARFRIVGCASPYHTGTPPEIWDYDPNAISEIFTNDTDSLMAKHVSDGNKWFMFQGDQHSAMVSRHNKDNGAGTVQEQFLVFNVAGMSSPNSSFSNDTDISAAEPSKGWWDWEALGGVGDYLTGAGVNPEWLRVWDFSSRVSPETSTEMTANKRGFAVIVEVLGSRSTKEMLVRIVDEGFCNYASFRYFDDGGDNLPGTSSQTIVMR